MHPSTSGRALVAVLAACLLAAPVASHAQSAPRKPAAQGPGAAPRQDANRARTPEARLPADETRSRALLEQTQQALQRADYAVAQTAGQALVEESTRAYGADHPNVADALNLLGATYLRLGKFNEAEAQFRRMLALAERSFGAEHEYTAAALNSLAVALEKLGDFTGAESLLRRAVAILDGKLGKQHPDTATTISNLARVLDAQGKFSGASAVQSAPAARTVAGDPAAGVALRAQEALRRGQYEEAETLHHQVLAIHEKSLGEHPTTARSMSNLGNVLYLQGKYADAEAVYRRALTMREKLLGANHPDVATSLNNLANVLQELNKDQRMSASEARARARVGVASSATTDVEAMYRRALSIQQTALGAQNPETANTLNNLAVMLSLRGDFSQAEKLHRDALATMEKVFGEQHPATAAILSALSLALDRQGKLVEAEASYQRAVEISRKAGNPRALLENASRLGFSLAKRGRYREALPYYLESVETLDFLYSQTRGYSEETRHAFLAQFSAVYRETIRILLQLNRANPGAGFDRQALAVASRNQSRVFTEMMRQADVARFSGEPAFIKLRESRDQLQERLAQLRQARATVPVTLANAAQRVADFDAQLGQATKQLGALEDELWQRYPRFMELANPRPVTVEDLQGKLLKPGEALLTYVLLPQETVIFVLTPGSFRMAVTGARRADLANRVHRIRRAIDKVAAGESVLFLRDIDPDSLGLMHRDLIAPVEAELAGAQKVFVVADGPLHTLPFELMVRPMSEAQRTDFEREQRASNGSAEHPYLAEYKRLPYLGDQYKFAYLPSLAALASQRLYPKARTKSGTDLVAFADPLFEPDAAKLMPARTQKSLALLNVGFSRSNSGVPLIPRLMETALEAKEIAAVLGGDNRLFIGERAQESVVKKGELRDARFVLFATHGFLGGEFVPSDLPVAEGEQARAAPRNQAQPALALTLVGDLLGEDGLLTMKEIIEDLELDAELVALSACNTAGDSAEANNGEGFAGLTRAFMYAGARSLLVSHWSVDSLSTQALMTTTFRNIKNGMAPIGAMSAAQRGLRTDGYTNGQYHFSRAHPFFWAPFVYVGD